MIQLSRRDMEKVTTMSHRRLRDLVEPDQRGIGRGNFHKFNLVDATAVHFAVRWGRTGYGGNKVTRRIIEAITKYFDQVSLESLEGGVEL